jgi:hypothetical protein
LYAFWDSVVFKRALLIVA